jgi:hypothetical protein
VTPYIFDESLMSHCIQLDVVILMQNRHSRLILFSHEGVAGPEVQVGFFLFVGCLLVGGLHPQTTLVFLAVGLHMYKMFSTSQNKPEN